MISKLFPQVVRVLLAAGADVAAQDDLDGKTPLHIANVDSEIQV